MSYKSDFEDATGWNAVDTNVKLVGKKGKAFIGYLRANGVSTIIRYYSSSHRSKTMSREEAIALSEEGFSLLPVFQDRNRELEDFGSANGAANARSAAEFATYIGQPVGTTILFAVDSDFEEDEYRSHIEPYFAAIRSEIGTKFRIGAYGSGYVLSSLLAKKLIDVAWISMSRGFTGTKEFFYSNEWAMRQVPPDLTHDETETSYDRNVLKLTPIEIGAFSVSESSSVATPSFVTTFAGVAAEPSPQMLGREFFRAEPVKPNAYTTTEGVNFRRTPDGEIIAELTVCQAVTDNGPAEIPGWRKVSIGDHNGYVFGKYLRRPAAPDVETLLRNAILEWIRFDKGEGDEKAAPYYEYVGEMWRSIGEHYDGRSVDSNGRDIPWSAAFISFVVRKSGSRYSKFKFAAGHSVFSNDAIQARILGRIDRPFWGYRVTEVRPEIGDVIHRNRSGNSFSFDYAENHSQFVSHSDIVVEVTSNVVRVIGGNIGDTVSSYGAAIQEYELDPMGMIAPDQKVIAILKNRVAEIP